MKTLVIRTANFKLPDDFDGTDKDAVMLLAEYLKNKPPKHTGNKMDESETLGKNYKDSWAHYLDALRRGKRFVGEVQIHETTDWPVQGTQGNES